jgi:selenide,water dikinase
MKRMLLIGGGHSHLEVLRAFGEWSVPDVRIDVVNPVRHAPYSGMIPGLIAGDYDWPQCHIDLARLCGHAQARLIEDRATGIDAAARCVRLASGTSAQYDLLSIDIGSASAGGEVAGVREHAVSVKPIDGLLAAVERLQDRTRGKSIASVAVVGAGAAGIELALALQRRLRAGTCVEPAFVLLSDRAQVLPDHGARARRIVERILRERGIQVLAGVPVAAVTATGLELADGRRVPANAVIWAAGAAAATWLHTTDLALDGRGFIAIDRTLRSKSHPDVFAAGDCATHVEDPQPKSGVFAVRQGPVLAANLRCALAGEAPAPFVASTRALALLNCGDRHAVASRGGMALEGRWVWHWKDWIDRRFVNRFGATA